MFILADAVPAADPMRWVEAGIKAFQEGGWLVMIGGAVLLCLYWGFKFGWPWQDRKKKGGE